MKQREKLFTYVATLLFIIILNFLLPRLMPGDPFLAIYGEEAALTLSAETKQELIAQMSLDKPLWIQFGAYLHSLFRGDLGYSYALNAPVSSVIAGVLPWSALLVGSALILSTLLGFVLGVESGWRKGSRSEKLILFSIIGISGLPSFLIGVIFLLFFAAQLDWFPLGGALTPYSDFTGLTLLQDILKHLFLPAMALSLTQLSEILLLTRASMLTNLSSPYVHTAAAKGLKPLGIRYRHAGRNSLLPVSARLGVSVGSALAGSLFIEIVFAYPGMGDLLHQALLNRDYPLLQGIFLTIAVTIILANFLADKIAWRIDPRMREE